MMMSPPNYMPPPVAGQNLPPGANKPPQPMQNMSLNSPPLQNSGPMHNEPVGLRKPPPNMMSPQHRGHSTTVTYSGYNSHATYPYNNFPPAADSPENNNQYTDNKHSFQSPSRNVPLKTNDVNHTLPYSENGISSGLSNLKLENQTNRMGHPGSYNNHYAPVHSNSHTPLQPPMNRPANVQSFGPPASRQTVNTQQLPQSPMNSPLNMPASPPFSHTSSPGHMMNSDLSPPNNLSQMPPVGYPSNQPMSPQYPGMPSSPPSAGGMWPNQPGASPNYPYAQQSPPMAPLQQQQPQRIGLDQMPSNVQVREEDKKTRNGYYATDVKGQPPPLVTTDFIVQDRGMCSPRFIRSTVYCLPNQPDMLKQTGIPFALTVSPMSKVIEGETAPPLALYREEGPLRCKRCKAYVCPFMTFMEGGRCFQCAFCKVVTEVPQDYFCFLDGMGERTDKYHRPELCLGSYEFLATKEYCRNEQMPNPPAYIFMIEVSNATFRNGLVPLLCENMKNVLLSLKEDKEIDTSKLRVGFVTYNNVLHFYNLKKNLTQPHVMVCSDVHNAFVPLLEGFLVTLTEAEALVDCLMEHIPRLFISEPATEIILGPVVQVGLEALKTYFIKLFVGPNDSSVEANSMLILTLFELYKNANCSGKLLIFHSTIPTADAPGKLTHREGQKVLGTDKQKTVLAPQHEFYSKLAQECVAAGCAIDLFLFPSAYIDIATMAPLCRYTGGQIYKYTYFQSHVDGDQFLKDLKRNITTETAFDAVLRVRTSAGMSPVFYYGNFYMSNNTDVELSALDGNKSITIEMAYDDKIPENDTIYVQAALLYTTIAGERRIRVHNLAIPTSVGMPDVFKCCEMDAMINYFAKQSVKLVLESTPQQVKSNLISRGVKILSCYRKHCATNSAAGQLILADSLKLFPLYINCLLKSDAVGGGSELSLDDKSFAMQAVNTMGVRSTAIHFYPTLLPLHEVDPDSESIPTPIRCSIEKLNDNGAYLLENGIYMFLWIGQAISSDWLQNVFDVQSTHQVDKQRTSLPELDTALSKKINSIIEDLEKRRQWCMRLRVLVQGDKMEGVFRQFLVEDRGVDGGPSYVDFLCHLHREISKNL